nr:hypothetical protein [Tawny frogmouth aviadenovirus A]
MSGSCSTYSDRCAESMWTKVNSSGVLCHWTDARST